MPRRPALLCGFAASLLLATMLGASPALATEAPAAKDPASAAAEEKLSRERQRAAEIAAAVDACEKGAAVPLDPQAKAAPVQFRELMPPDFNMAPLEKLAADCAKAWGGHQDDDRLKLMALRTAAAHYKTRLDPLVAPIRALAAGGSAEANYLIYAIRGLSGQDGEQPQHGISRDEAVAALDRAAAAGHQEALLDRLDEQRGGPLLRRDPKGAIETARRIAALPPQGPQPGATEAEIRALGARATAYLILTTDGLAPELYAEGFAALEKIRAAEPDRLALPLASAVRFGRGTVKDPEGARKFLEGEIAAGRFDGAGMLAAMLANGEGGPTDGRRAIALLSAEEQRFAPGGAAELATLLTDNRFAGPDPNRAVRALAASRDIDDAIRAVPLLIDYATPLDDPDRLARLLAAATEAGEPGAGLALARLRIFGPSPFHDIGAGRAILMRLAADGDVDATWLLASTQYANLDTASSAPYRLDDGGPTDDAIRALIEKGGADRRPEAYLLLAKLQRRGVIYPQDDKAATISLISAANLGSVEAMVLLGEAYDDGLGIAKDPRARLLAWREAAKRGSLAAREKIASAFTFDSFDKLITLREGITERVALYNNDLSGAIPGFSATMTFTGLFSGGRASDAGADALAGAVLEGFRLAPAGLAEDRLVGTLKAMPDEIRLAMETALQRDGFLKRQPDGYFSPDARDALRAFVEAKGPLAGDAPAEAAAAAADPDALDPALVAKVRDRIFADIKAVKTKKQRTAAIRALNSLARYGDLSARWALVVNYDEADFVRNNVSPDELTRYGLDILVARPAGMEKPDFELVFALTEIQSAGRIAAFGNAALDAVRDDPRLQDPLALGGVLGALVFAPGACDAILAAAGEAGVGGLGEEGCDEASRAALIAYAKEKGPAGRAAAERKAGAGELATLAKRK